MLRRVPLARTDVSEELSASIRMTRICELGTTLAVTSNRRTLRRNAKGRILQGTRAANKLYRLTTATCRQNVVPTFVDRGVSRGQRCVSRTDVNLSFVDRSR
jgi:hypothetical protein